MKALTPFQPTLEMFGHLFGRRCGTVHARQNADVVAGGHLAVLPANAHERARFGGVLCGFGLAAEGVVALEFGHCQIVNMYVIARCDIRAGVTDNLVVAVYRIAGFDRAARDLVSGSNLYGRPDALGDFLPGGYVFQGDKDIVLGVKQGVVAAHGMALDQADYQIGEKYSRERISRLSQARQSAG